MTQSYQTAKNAVNPSAAPPPRGTLRTPTPPNRYSRPAEAPAVTMDPVANLLGGDRTIAYKASLAHAVGSSLAGLLLSQFWYWTNHLGPDAEERDGWFFKGRDEIHEETALTRYEQEGARKRLVQLGVLQEERRGVPARLWFRLDKDRLYELLREYLQSTPRDSSSGNVPATQLGEFPPSDETPIQLGEIPPSSRGKSRRLAGGNSPTKQAVNPPSITESTHQTTLEMTQREPDIVDKSEEKMPIPPALLDALAAEAAENRLPAGMKVSKTGTAWSHLIEAEKQKLLEVYRVS